MTTNRMTINKNTESADVSEQLKPRLAKLVLALSLTAILSGCGVGNLMGGGATTQSNATQLAATTASQADITLAQSSALPAIATECPQIKIKEGTETLFAYENNRIGDPRSLQFQAVIDGQSRNCVVSNGLITVKMGVVGRLLLGPKPATNSLNLPLRFVVERDSVPVFNQVYNVPVSVTPPSQSEEFVKVVENVAIPYLGGESVVIWVGFDPLSS